MILSWTSCALHNINCSKSLILPTSPCMHPWYPDISVSWSCNSMHYTKTHMHANHQSWQYAGLDQKRHTYMYRWHPFLLHQFYGILIRWGLSTESKPTKPLLCSLQFLCHVSRWAFLWRCWIDVIYIIMSALVCFSLVPIIAWWVDLRCAGESDTLESHALFEWFWMVLSVTGFHFLVVIVILFSAIVLAISVGLLICFAASMTIRVSGWKGSKSVLWKERASRFCKFVA